MNTGQTLNPKYTFDTFVVGPGNSVAHASCMAVAIRLMLADSWPAICMATASGAPMFLSRLTALWRKLWKLSSLGVREIVDGVVLPAFRSFALIRALFL